ncbi:IS66 family insertion sequence element accessory protein TnpB [Allopusillimonas ginsengisoli]|nr:IS66 family insertion sequence element accessory protein TnpB [Allopusillimonas ginsengisoli]
MCLWHPWLKDFRAARPHHAYIFTSRRANSMKILVHDGLGVWLAARRLNQGRFVWPRPSQLHVELTDEQLQYLAIGLPWHRMGVRGRPVPSGNLSEFLSRFFGSHCSRQPF